MRLLLGTTGRSAVARGGADEQSRGDTNSGNEQGRRACCRMQRLVLRLLATGLGTTMDFHLLIDCQTGLTPHLSRFAGGIDSPEND